jgi:hypothetical protein
MWKADSKASEFKAQKLLLNNKVDSCQFFVSLRLWGEVRGATKAV